jgi:glycosyltransferase involved in cell wall biosynthesis
VVAARIGAIPELVEHEVTGLLATPGDGEALAAAVQRALDDPASAAWAEAGRRRVRHASDPAGHVDALTQIYKEIS